MKYLEGLSIDAIGRGNRRLLGPLKARHAERHAEYTDALTAWQAKRQTARELKDPAKRAEALEALKGERPTHPAMAEVGCAVVGGVVLWPVLHGWHTVAVTGGVTVWTLAALVAGQKPSPEQTETAPPAAGREATSTLAEDTEQAATDAFLADLHRLMPAPGDRMHLAQIAGALLGDEAATGRVRELCAATGVPISAVRVRGRGSSTGVYARDLPPLPDRSPRPLLAVVGAGHDGQQQHQQHDADDIEKGFASVPHPDGNPARSAIVWADEADRQAS